MEWRDSVAIIVNIPQKSVILCFFKDPPSIRLGAIQFQLPTINAGAVFTVRLVASTLGGDRPK